MIRIAIANAINVVAAPAGILLTAVRTFSIFIRPAIANPIDRIPFDKSFISILDNLSIDNAKIPKAMAIISNDPILTLCEKELSVP